jgi:pyruvate dehydrogenase E2 component (dihydrolipoamide acetyltransferase)
LSTQIIIPHVGETTTTVRIARWLKAEGQPVRKGEPILEVDTDKSTLEIEALADGILEKILIGEGMEAEAMAVVGLIGTGAPSAQVSPPVAVPNHPPAPHATPIALKVALDLGVDVNTVIGSGPGGRITQEDVRDFAAKRVVSQSRPDRVTATPKAKRLAAELGVDLASVTAAHPDRLIRASDINPSSVQPVLPAKRPGLLPLSRRRRAIAARMTLSKTTVPHFYLQVDVDMSLCVALRDHCAVTLGWARKPTFNDLVVRAAALAMRAMPRVNMSFDGDGYAPRETVNIGIAVSLEDGLIVPVLRDADKLGLAQTHQQAQELAERARAGKFRDGDLSEKSIVVTNLGMHGMDAFFAIIDPPDPMILAVGRIRDVIVPVKGQAVVRPQCVFTLSADHRVLDGALAAQYLARVKALLEQPFELMG